MRSVDLSRRVGLTLCLVLALRLALALGLLGWDLVLELALLCLTRNSSSCSSPDSDGGSVGSSRRVKGVLGTVAVSAKAKGSPHVLSTKQTGRGEDESSVESRNHATHAHTQHRKIPKSNPRGECGIADGRGAQIWAWEGSVTRQAACKVGLVFLGRRIAGCRQLAVARMRIGRLELFLFFDQPCPCGLQCSSVRCRTDMQWHAVSSASLQ